MSPILKLCHAGLIIAQWNSFYTIYYIKKIMTMKAIISAYKTHEEAVEAIKELQNAGYNSKRLSIIGKTNELDKVPGVKNSESMAIAGAEVGFGALAGSVLGVLTGVGIFAIPGLGFLYGAGALVGAIAGFDFGIIGGGIASALTVAGLSENDSKQYEEMLKKGNFLLIAQGDEAEIAQAKNILEAHGKSIKITHH
jgi:uncharacterized membrane protein